MKTIQTNWNAVSVHGSHSMYKEINKNTVVFVNGHHFKANTCLEGSFHTDRYRDQYQER